MRGSRLALAVAPGVKQSCRRPGRDGGVSFLASQFGKPGSERGVRRGRDIDCGLTGAETAFVRQSSHQPQQQDPVFPHTSPPFRNAPLKDAPFVVRRAGDGLAPPDSPEFSPGPHRFCEPNDSLSSIL